MKLCIHSDNFPSKGNPVFIFVQQLVFALADMGVDVYVVAPQSITHTLFHKESFLPIHSIEQTKKGKSFHVYRPLCVSFGANLNKLNNIASKFSRFSLNSILEKISPDVLYGHFWHRANLLVDYASKHNRPLFVACGEGDDALENLICDLSSKELNKLKNTVSGVISVSTENAMKCLNYGLIDQNRITVLPNCVDDSLFKPYTTSPVRGKLGINKNDFVVLFVGGFIHRKGSKRLSEALQSINEKNIKAIFIGKLLENEADPSYDNIVFKGTVDHDELPEYLNASDIFVLPTLKEGCCNAIVEALACGVPVVSSARSFNVDILNKENSILVDPENIDEIKSAIKKLYQDKELYNRMKQYALTQSSNYSIIERATKIYNFIKTQI